MKWRLVVKTAQKEGIQTLSDIIQAINRGSINQYQEQIMNLEKEVQAQKETEEKNRQDKEWWQARA